MKTTKLKQTHFYSDAETLVAIEKLRGAGFNISAFIRKAVKEAAQKIN